MSDGFFSRWSRRKQDARTGQLAEDAAQTEADTAAQATVPAPLPEPPVQATNEAPLPSMEDVQALGPASDFQPFMRRGVQADVRNAAMKKLFADPHFNVMDGLDIYIGDYTQPDPLPEGMLAQMAGAQFLKLVPHPRDASADAQGSEAAQENPDQSPQTQQSRAVVAQSPDSAAPMAATSTDHDDTDLQLQPDPAAAGRQAGPGPR